MEGRREIGNSVVIALISIGLIVGALSISLVEFAPQEGPSPTLFLIPSPELITATTISIGTSSPTSTQILSNPSSTPTSSTTTGRCPIPSGWGIITVQATDTLETIAARYRVTADELRRANCLHVAMVIAQGSGRFEARHRHKDGHEFEVEVSATYMEGSGKFFVFCHDITERKAAEEKIRNLAFYDALTQLPNRRMLSDRMAQAMASSKRSGCYGALMFIDMDNFKPLNEAHGHNVGDVLLVQVARRIVSCVREMDTVARFGGDEFVVMLRELYVDEAESIAQSGVVAEKISAILAEPYLC